MWTELKSDLSFVSDDDEEDAPSLCDLPQNGKAVYENRVGDSDRGCSEQQDFNFDLGSIAYQACPAYDLFCQGRLLPLTPKDAAANPTHSFPTADQITAVKIATI